MGMYTDGLNELIVDFGKVPAKVIKNVRPIVFKTAMQLKKQMVADVQASEHFRGKRAPGLDASIDFDINESSDLGTHLIQAEIGPNKAKAPAAALAHIAYWGGANGGGGTVTDPVVRMRQEEPKFIGFIQMAVEDLL